MVNKPILKLYLQPDTLIDKSLMYLISKRINEINKVIFLDIVKLSDRDALNIRNMGIRSIFILVYSGNIISDIQQIINILSSNKTLAPHNNNALFMNIAKVLLILEIIQ